MKKLFIGHFYFFIIMIVFYYNVVVYGSESGSKNNFENVYLFSNNLIVDIHSNTTDFNGNVKLEYNDLTIVSDYLRIINFNNHVSNKNLFPIEYVDKIVAKGNVKIEFNGKVSTSDFASYLVLENTLTLDGSVSTITYADSVISGAKIICYMNEDRVVVESASNDVANATLLISDLKIKE